MITAQTIAHVGARRFERQLIELLQIPSISTLNDHAMDVQRAAEWLVADMKQIGMTAEVHQAEGFLPLVYGEWMGAGANAPTILIYCHYDVQPAEMRDGWETNPFEPVEKDGKIYARGAVDSKSHVMAQLKAIESALKADEPMPINVKVLFEGEEESGSDHIFGFVQQNPDKLKADAIVVSDGSHPHPNQPMLEYAIRGIITAELHVQGPRRDLHSGHYGGTVHNPIQALAEIIAQLHDENGTVTVLGFYDDVLPLTNEEREVLSEQKPWVDKEWHELTGAPQPWGESEYDIHERMGARPTLEINGIEGGFYDAGFKTVLPSRAMAKISCRLVPNQDPQRIFDLLKAHLSLITPPTVTAELINLEMGAYGVLLDRKGPAIQAAIAAYEKGWGVKPIFAREGGSVPVVAEFQKHLSAPIVMMPFGYKGGGAHGPNEYVIVDMFHKGIQTMLHFYHEFAALHQG